MINKIYINNFKLFKKEIEIPMSNINLFTGINGKGKSTVLQIFLLLSQSAINNRATNKIYLNGVNVKLGSFDDVKNRDTPFSERIHFGFDIDEINLNYFLHNSKPDDSELYIETISCYNASDSSEYILNKDESWYSIDIKNSNSQYDNSKRHPIFDLFLSQDTISQYFPLTSLESIMMKLNLVNIHYVSADRIGPKNFYENKSLNHFLNVGALGENTVNLLYHLSNEIVHEVLFDGYCDLFGEKPEDLSHTIEDNTNYWVSKIFQGAKIQVEPIKGEELIRLRINSDGKSAYFKPTNVGYGFSYSLPIIVAGLTVKPGEILIVENPEAHLHPFAQSIMAKFLSLVALSGVQVIIESHSEHILNGLRISVFDKIIKSNDLNILYFDKNDDESLFNKIEVDEEGGIENWPKSFFDQASNDLDHLLNL